MEDNVDLVGKIAKAVFNDQALADVDWVETTIVFSFEPDGFCSGHFGYAYDERGEATAFTLNGDDAENEATAYREWLREGDDEGLSRMLFQFNRETSRFNVEFDYGDSQRWRVTPSNIDTIVEKLRPNLGGD